MSEEELAIFDILTKPDLELSNAERDEVKRIARDLLGRVKHEVAAIDWERSPQSRATVHSAIRAILDHLPQTRYDQSLWNDKVSRTYLWIRQRYGANAGTTPAERFTPGPTAAPGDPASGKQ